MTSEEFKFHDKIYLKEKKILKHFPKDLRKYCPKCCEIKEVCFNTGDYKGNCKSCGAEVFTLVTNWRLKNDE